MKRIYFDYSVKTDYVKPTSDSLASPVNQDVVGSVFIVNPETHLIDDCLSQVLSDPSNPRNEALLKNLRPLGSASDKHLSDDDLLALSPSRYAQTPSELSAYSKHINSVIDTLSPQNGKSSSIPESDKSSSSDNVVNPSDTPNS